jgi:PAS domain S-box-containing protein
MSEPLRVLLVEDSVNDAKLVVHELRRHDPLVHVERVETARAMRAALDTGAWDVIISDWKLPSFSGLGALQVLKEAQRHVAFIIVSGSVPDQAAVEAMRAGAHDYVFKDNLSRLAPVVEREVREGRARTALMKRRDEDQRFFDLSLDMLCIAGFDGYFKRVNPAWAATLGWSAEKLLATPYLDFVHPDDRQTTIDAEAQLADRAASVVGFENRYRCKDGKYCALLWTAAPFVEENLIYAAARDITARKKLEGQFLQAQKMEAVGRLAGGVAHDFNNVLSVVLSYTDLILEDLKTGDPLRDDISEIHQAGKRATELTRQLLAFSRQQVLQPQIVDLNGIIAGMEKMLRRLVREDVALSLMPARALGKVRVDPGQIEQIVMNIVVNARDAMPDGGTISIETEDVELDDGYAREHVDARAGRHVLLAISDTGIGMDADTRARVFEPFFTTKPKHEGTGLGLSTVFGIVQQSGGHVAVYSELDHGTTFKIYFPRTDLDETSVAAPVIVQGILTGTETILLVEDEDQVRVLARTILQRGGYNVLLAQNGGDALLVCEQYGAKIQLLLTDVVMPRMNGRQLAERVASVRPEMKCLFMSGYADNAIVNHGVLESDVAYLQKPFTPSALLRKVRDVLDAPG